MTQDEVAVERSELHRLDWSGSKRSWTVVVDAGQHPIGVVDAGAVFDGEVFPAVVANIDSDPAEVAQRISTAESDPWIPVVATDDFGRYVGIVTVRRLLGHLSQRST